jgi:hypothetical protein
MTREEAIEVNLKMLEVKIEAWNRKGIGYKTNHHIQQLMRMQKLDEYSDKMIANNVNNKDDE